MVTSTSHTINQGDIWWADLPASRGSEPGFRRPVIVIQQTPINLSQIRTAICVPITSNLKLANALGNVFMPRFQSGLPKDSVANVSQIITLDKQFLIEYVHTLSDSLLSPILDGVVFMLGR